MKINLFLPLFLVLSLLKGNITHAQSEVGKGIVFERMGFSKALQKSKETGKLVFLDCFVSWCGPCRRLSHEVFTQNSVGSFFNDNFICLTLDMEGNGSDIKRKYQVNSYPTLLFVDQDGNVVQKSIGFLTSQKLIDLGMLAMDPDNNSRALSQRFQKGETDYKVIENQLHLRDKNTSAEYLLDKYFKNIEPSQWYEKDAWALIKRYVTISSTYFKFLLVNEEMFDAKYGKKTVERVIEGKFDSFYTSDFQEMGMNKQKACEYLKSFQHPLATKVILRNYKNELVDQIMDSPKKAEYWVKLLRTIDKLIINFGANEKENFRTTAFRLCHQKIYSQKVRLAIESTKDKWAPTMVQNLEICQLEMLLKKESLDKKEINEINVTGQEIADSILAQVVYIDQLAGLLLGHAQRENFLSVARKLSFSIINTKALNYLTTYANICAQMKDFDEAVKYTNTILKMAHKWYPDRVESIEGMLAKFQQHQTPY